MLGLGSSAPSPLPNTPSDPKSEIKPKTEDKPTTTASSSRQSPTEDNDGVLSMIDTSLKTPRTAAMDGVDKTLKVPGDNDDTRDKCVVMLYNALAIDSRAGGSSHSGPD